MGSNMMTKPRAFSLSLVLALGLVACGGGGDSPAPTSVLPTITLPIRESSYLAGSAELAGYTVLQQARKLCDFRELTQDTRLDDASLNHARYRTSVSFASGTSVLSHYEDITTDPYYAGHYPWDRTVVTNYGTYVAEILVGTWWFYDRSNLSLVIPSLAQRGTESIRSLLDTVYVNAVVGPPIYLKVDRGQKLSVADTSKIVSQSGHEVPFSVLTHANDPNIDPISGKPFIDPNEVFVVPTVPLDPYTTYQVTLYGSIDGMAFTRSFAMSTGS